ncbi:ankyrin [Annulohypoxylon moriforme]|nr:ankyrin [Annulohypoxylon moriforme]
MYRLDLRTTLPKGVVVRTPSPVMEHLAFQHLPAYHEQSLDQSSRLLVSSPTTVFDLPPSRIHRNGPQDTIQLFQGYQNDSNILQFVVKKNTIALQSLPWVIFKNEIVDSRFTPISPMFSFLEELNSVPMSISSLSTWNTGAYHILAKAIYLISNNLLHNRYGIIQFVLERTPKSILLGLFQSNRSNTRALWDVLAFHAGKYGYKDIFILLMEVGLRRSGWVLPNGHCHLASAASMNALGVVRDLLGAGVRADDETLLLEKCDVSHPIHIKNTPGMGRTRKCSISSRESNFHLFIFALISRKIIVHRRRDNAYPPNSYKEINKNEFMVNFDIDNESQSRALGMILDNGANVDSMYGNKSDRIDLFYHEIQIPNEWHLTALDRCYYRSLDVYNRLAPYSSQLIDRITRPGICLSAKRGKGPLLEYLSSKSTDSRFGKKFLELVFADQFLITGSDIDFEVVRTLIEIGVDPKLASVSLGDNHLLHLLIGEFQVYGYCENFRNITNFLLESGISVDSEVLEAGVEETGIDILTILSGYGADISKYGAKALLTAALLNNYRAVSWLLDAGVDINTIFDIDSKPWSIITLAATSHIQLSRFNGKLWGVASCEMIKYLVGHGALLHDSRHNLTPFDFLHRLLSYTLNTKFLLEKVRFITDMIVDQHDLSKPGACLLEASLCIQPHLLGFHETSNQRGDKLAIFELLIKKGVPIRGSRVLASLILYGARNELIQEILDAGVDINEYSDGHGPCAISITPIQAAAKKGDIFWVDQLIRMGADVNRPGLGDEVTALQAACQGIPNTPQRMKDKLSLVQLLIENGADVNAPAATGREGVTALQAAVEAGDLETVMLLIHYNADPNLYLDQGKPSTLDLAARFGRIDMVQFFLNLGALSSFRGVTGYDGAIKKAKRAKHYAVADLIERHAENDIRVFGTNLAMSFRDDNEMEYEMEDEMESEMESEMTTG